MVLLYMVLHGSHQYTPNVSIYTSTMDSMGYENYLNIFWKWLGTVGARVVQRCSLTFKHILLSLVQWWRPTQRNVHWENCSLQFIQTPILPMLNLEVTTCFYWITMCFHLWSGAILIHDLLWGFPKMWDPQTIAFSWKTNKQLWMICWVPKKIKNFLDPHHHLSSLSPNSKNFRLNFSWRSRRHRYELQSAGHLTKKAVEPSSPSLQPPKSWN